MAYFRPYIDETGLHIPSYSDIRDDLIQQAKSIYGQDIYLGADSQDYQLISVISIKSYDTMLALQEIFNSRGPGTAIGSALDGIVKINGISRGVETFSTAIVTLTGTAGTLISNGIVQDNSGYKWSVPEAVIGQDGTISVMVTCQQAGPISVIPGDITKIVTPTYGWATVLNTSYATIGKYKESDSELRARQEISTAQASRTLLEGLKGSLASISSVTRSEVYENDTSVINANGLPPHSITAVIEGGLDYDIAQAIFLKKGPGCYTNGSVIVVITDFYEQQTNIRFYRPVYVDVDVTVDIKQLPGYNSQTTLDIQTAINDLLNSVGMGIKSIPISSFWGSVLSVMTNLAQPTFSVLSIVAARHGQSQSTQDIKTYSVDEAIRGNISYIIINASEV